MKVSSFCTNCKNSVNNPHSISKIHLFKKNRMYNIQSALKYWTCCSTTVTGALCKHRCKKVFWHKNTMKSVTWSAQTWGFRKTRFVLVSTTFWLTSSSSVAALSHFFANFFFMLPIKLSYLKEKKRRVGNTKLKFQILLHTKHSTARLWKSLWSPSSYRFFLLSPQYRLK